MHSDIVAVTQMSVVVSRLSLLCVISREQVHFILLLYCRIVSVPRLQTSTHFCFGSRAGPEMELGQMDWGASRCAVCSKVVCLGG